MDGEQKGSKSDYNFPPGFRFHPSDEELIVHYLQNKIKSRPLPASIIAEIDLYKYNPWELPNKSLFGEEEWFFFSPRDRKYPNGLRPNRTAASGRPPKGGKTDWIMNEYRLVDTTMKSFRLKGSMRLDDWVLCRVRHRGYSLKNLSDNQENHCEPSKPVNLQKGEEQQTNTSFRADMITDYQYKDYQIIASILVGGVIPPTENMSSVSFKEMRSNNLTSVYEESFDKMNSQTTIPSLECYFNPLKRKFNEDDEQLENLISFNSKFNIENKIEKSPSIDFQELNKLTFAERYQQ
ncbi:unnamed protein product [Vicia faba]|uniref:NAC domain-containing protein n=1 Tax=Vicia faba TaxID=3906 RepID=A0AAV0Z6Z3_VICFA|nr:unnamed protein product [Vicia faba]